MKITYDSEVDALYIRFIETDRWCLMRMRDTPRETERNMSDLL